MFPNRTLSLEQVLLSEFVKPSVKVLDYRTEITGASAETLKKVTYMHSDAQKAVLKLLSEPGTILVGHGLQHDLR
jgi:RNA exonuclease 1